MLLLLCTGTYRNNDITGTTGDGIDVKYNDPDDDCTTLFTGGKHLFIGKIPLRMLRMAGASRLKAIKIVLQITTFLAVLTKASRLMKVNVWRT